jgi:Asp-tRNA(Asn)/Glu-tRNA(Gln) amidotransferase A subunit family amidase
MASEPVHYLSLMDVSARLTSGELKPTALTEMILVRIARYDGTLRSYTTLLADRAIDKARTAEEELNRGSITDWHTRHPALD